MNIEVQASLLRVAKFGIANNFSPCMLVFEKNSRRISNNPILVMFLVYLQSLMKLQLNRRKILSGQVQIVLVNQIPNSIKKEKQRRPWVSVPNKHKSSPTQFLEQNLDPNSPKSRCMNFGRGVKYYFKLRTAPQIYQWHVFWCHQDINWHQICNCRCRINGTFLSSQDARCQPGWEN